MVSEDEPHDVGCSHRAVHEMADEKLRGEKTGCRRKRTSTKY